MSFHQVNAGITQRKSWNVITSYLHMCCYLDMHLVQLSVRERLKLYDRVLTQDVDLTYTAAVHDV